jgi:dipeptidyl aminopeptidase/acylaminoacyl peptidase
MLPILPLVLATLLAAADADSPEARQPTDPATVASEVRTGAGPVSIESLFDERSIADGGWSSDGKKVVFSTNTSGRFNLWVTDESGGAPQQITTSDDRQFSPLWSPDGKWIVFESDRAGAEVFNLFAVPAGGGAAVNLTNTPDVSETGPAWSLDGTQLAFTMKPKTASVSDIAVMDWSTRKVRAITHEASKDYLWSGPVWSPDGKSLYATRGDTGDTDSDVYRLNPATGAAENLTAHEGKHRTAVSSISPDGKTLLVTADRTGGFLNVALLDVATKQLTWVTDTKWEVSAGDISPDGRLLTYVVNEDGRADAYVAPVSGGAAEKIAVPAGLNAFPGPGSAFTRAGDRLLLTHASSTQPGDLWQYDLTSKTPRQLTFSAPASLAAVALPGSQLVRYQSFDGKVISAFLWLPFNIKRDGTSPAIVLPHGGPTGQTVDSFNRTDLALVSRGYICIAPNVRGSTGYGAEFQAANHADLGGGDLQDEVYAVKFLIATGYANAKKIGITGGSYGGFMTLMAIGRAPAVWRAAVEEYGIISWLTMLEHSDPLLQQYEKGLLGDPVKDRAVYDADSPLTYIRKATAPLLVLQGDNDIRVPKEEAQQVVQTLQSAGKTVSAHYYSNEGHGFSKRENQIDALDRTVAWFDQYLK